MKSHSLWCEIPRENENSSVSLFGEAVMFKLQNNSTSLRGLEPGKISQRKGGRRYLYFRTSAGRLQI
jgi:hypothetical protein